MSDGAVAGPLVLRVRPRGDGTLVDELTARAEEALDRLRAPGALYDESACAPLPALGGWLFRARAARRAGILVVLEELDGCLDLRGDRDRAESALAALGQLLEERARRPLSLLCTVRASDPAAHPALPAPLAALFDERVSLGGARAVARDPGGLVAMLAGRTFTRASLARAVSAWCEVPDEDSVLVFSSPLAPTRVPMASEVHAVPTLEEPAAHPPSEAPLLFADRPLGAASRESPLDPGPTSASAAREPAPLGPAPRAWMDVFRAALSLRSALDTLGDPSARRSTRQLERAFSRSIVPIPRALESLRAGGASLGARTDQLERRAVDSLRGFERAFSEAYASAFAAWVAGATRPSMLPDLEARLRDLALERGARATAVVLCTGLRADGWSDLREGLVASASGLALLEQGLHWAARPVTVAAQRALWSRGPSALGAPDSHVDQPPVPRSLEEASQPRRERVGRGEIHRITGYRHALSVEGSLSERLALARRAVLPPLASMITAMPPGSLVLLAADVGAREDPPVAGAPAKAASEPSVFEALLPHAFLLWGAERM